MRPARWAIAERLIALLDPVWLRIGGYWYPRGGIPIDVFWQSGDAAGGRLDSATGRGAVSRTRVKQQCETGDTAGAENLGASGDGDRFARPRILRNAVAF